jgi:hypothetical protein
VKLLGLDEGFNFTDFPDDGTVLLVLLVEHLGVFEVVDEVVQALKPGVGQVADLG